MAAAPFKDNVVIITGASSGIGAELARQLAGQGARLALAARSVERLEAIAAECRAAGGAAIAVPTDVADEAQCRALIEQTAAAYGRIDTLVNNAGMNMLARFDEWQDLAIFEQILRVNFLGSVNCTRHALPYLTAARGRLVIINSAAGKAGLPLRTAYAASKHALTGFFDSLRIELEETGVSVTSIYPSYVASGFHERNLNAEGVPFGAAHRIDYSRAMTTARCAEITLRAMARRRREVVMTPRARIGQWLKLIAPGMVDRIARRAVQSGR
jgi:short-subunit dehydrogenase